MAFLYDRFPEIPNPDERYRFAVAAYNTGRSNINRCLALAPTIAAGGRVAYNRHDG